MTDAPPPIDDAGNGLATIGVFLATFAAWASLPISLWQAAPDLSFGFTQDNVIFLVAGSSLLATVTFAAGAVGLGSRSLLTAALVVTSLHLALHVAIGGVEHVLGARPALVLGTTAAALVLAVTLVGVIVGWFATRRGPTAMRWLALGIVVAAGCLIVFQEVSTIVPYIDLAAAVPLILTNVLASVAVVVAAGFLGLPRERARYIAAGLFGLLVAWFLVGVSWSFSVDRYYLGYTVGAAVRAAAYLAAAVLAVRAGLRLPGRQQADADEVTA
ncbi:hypothetical protein [Antribacter gilvus]|uniref:hypothetical protein n=1 Tax=Antribacter gilvus TaxID=2304675 RepID=UPI000F7AB728|nr:hypothetical protein [Antribacter gilvus]